MHIHNCFYITFILVTIVLYMHNCFYNTKLIILKNRNAFIGATRSGAAPINAFVGAARSGTAPRNAFVGAAGSGTAPTNCPEYKTEGARVKKCWALSSSSRHCQAAQVFPAAATVSVP